jgi:hypothetical protein
LETVETAAPLSAGETTSPPEAAGVTPKRQPRVPKHHKVLTRWRLTWRTVKVWYEQGKGYAEIAKDFAKLHPNHAVGADIIRDIIRAGTTGRLD